MSDLSLTDQLYDAILTRDTAAETAIKAKLEQLRDPHFYASAPTAIDVDFANVINDSHSTPLEIAEFMTRVYGPEWPKWEHATIEQKLLSDFMTAMTTASADRLWALKSCLVSTEAMNDWYAFNQVAMGLAGVGADFITLRMPTPGIVVFCFTLLKETHPDVEFDEEVIKYVCSLIIDNGIYCPPPSIFDEISTVMRWMLSKEIQLDWHEIYTAYNEMTLTTVPEENKIQIQAKRLYDTEAAALAYAGKWIR